MRLRSILTCKSLRFQLPREFSNSCNSSVQKKRHRILQLNEANFAVSLQQKRSRVLC